MRLAQRIKMLAQPDIAVVMANHPVTGIDQGLNELRWPGHELHAQTHDEQDDGALLPDRASARVFDFNINLICSNFHSLLRLFDKGYNLANYKLLSSTGAPENKPIGLRGFGIERVALKVKGL